MFEDVRHEGSLILLLSLVEPDIWKQSKITDQENDVIKNITLEKLHRERILKETVALDLLEKNVFFEEKIDINMLINVHGNSSNKYETKFDR